MPLGFVLTMVQVSCYVVFFFFGIILISSHGLHTYFVIENIFLVERVQVCTSSSVSSSHEEDNRKQQLAAQLFSGVTAKPRSSAGRGHLAASRISRNPGKTKLITADPVMSSADDRSHSIQGTTAKRAGKSNMDLLLDLESNEIRDIEGDKASSENILLSPLDNTVSVIPTRDDKTLDHTQESVDANSRLVTNPSAPDQNTQKVWHFLLFLILHLAVFFFLGKQVLLIVSDGICKMQTEQNAN